MSEYKISQVSQQPPRTWAFKDRRTGTEVPMETYKVRFEDVTEDVDVNRKPGNRPAVGETLTGTLEDSDFGKRFKAERKQFGGGGGPRTDSKEIQAMWSIGQAVAWINGVGMPADGSNDVADIIPIAEKIFAMVAKVKNSDIAKEVDKVWPVKDDEPVVIPDDF